MERTLLIHPNMPGLEPERGFHDINGPSLIRVPDWIENPLGRYYLYFAHHNGSYIRMAYADDLPGPYTIYKPGVLHLENTIFRSHIASPDVHIDDENRRLIMYFHGPYPEGGQQTAMSESTDGLNFAAHDVRLGTSYFRVFKWNDMFYASAFSKIYRSPDRNKPFELRKTDLFPWRVRHTAVLLKGDDMWVFQSRYGDAPEHIMVSTLKLTPDWNEWTPSEPVVDIKLYSWRYALSPILLVPDFSYFFSWGSSKRLILPLCEIQTLAFYQTFADGSIIDVTFIQSPFFGTDSVPDPYRCSAS